MIPSDGAVQSTMPVVRSVTIDDFSDPINDMAFQNERVLVEKHICMAVPRATIF